MAWTESNLIPFSYGVPDPLSVFPQTASREYQRNEIIYDYQDRSDTYHLITEGRVKVSRVGESGKEVILDFFQTSDFFGESGFLGDKPRGERAIALEKSLIMAWSFTDLKLLMAQTPALAAALLHILTQKLLDAQRRIESLCIDPIHFRLGKTLLRLAEHLGEKTDSKSIRLPPLTHEQMAHYVGTSREIITQYMNQFRRAKLLEYSRRGVDLDPQALQSYLEALHDQTRAA